MMILKTVHVKRLRSVFSLKGSYSWITKLSLFIADLGIIHRLNLSAIMKSDCALGGASAITNKFGFLSRD